jgi:hypothetical protein
MQAGEIMFKLFRLIYDTFGATALESSVSHRNDRIGAQSYHSVLAIRLSDLHTIADA